MKLNRSFYVSLGAVISFYTTIATAALIAPSGLKAAASSSSQISLSWSDNSDNESGFIIQRSLQASSGFMQIADLPAQSKSYVDSSLKAGTTYYYRVRAYKITRKQSINRTSFSNIAYAMTLSTLPNPTPTPTPFMTPTPAPTPPPATPTPTPAPSATPISGDACPLLIAEQMKYAGATVKSALSYGLKGDGTTDEYDAFQRLAADVSGKQYSPRLIIYFPKGTYYINRYIRPQGTGSNSNRAITYANASNFSLIGCTGAVVSVKGDFDMQNDVLSGGEWTSYTYQLNAFKFQSSSNFKLSGFEVNGNVNLMTRQKPAGTSLAETFSHAIVTSASKNYELSNMKVHHFAGDGFYIGDSPTVDDTAVYDNLESYNNSRQGMSIIQARNITVKNSTFRNTGFTDGSYPAHAPAAGVDVEPNWGPADGSLMTGNIVFDNCKFLDNKGSQWVGGDNGFTIENITIRNSQIRAQNYSFSWVVAMSLPGGVIENNYIDTANGDIYGAFYEGVGDITKNNVIIRGNTIVSSDYGLIVNDAGAQVTVANNTFISKGGGPIPYLNAGVSHINGNKVDYPATYFSAGSTAAVMKAPDFSGNILTTDLTNGDLTIKVSPGASATNNMIGAHILLGQ